MTCVPGFWLSAAPGAPARDNDKVMTAGRSMPVSLFEITKRYAYRIRPEALRPTIKWRSPT
jgi:hypothetical protein